MISSLRSAGPRWLAVGTITFGLAVLSAWGIGCGTGELAHQAATRPATGKPTDTRPAAMIDIPQTVFIRGGTFVMGTPIANRLSQEYHADEARMEVTVGDFFLGKTPVTASQFCQFLNSEDAKDQDHLYWHGRIGQYWYSTIIEKDGRCVPYPDAENAPANQVTWKGAVLYCEWLTRITGMRYRLPTEAEWEYAARGPEGRLWPWGNQPPDATRGYRRLKPWDKDSPNVNVNTNPVGAYPAGATPEGVMDMLAYGIGEWCVNKYKERPTPADVNDPTVELQDLKSPRAIRGIYSRPFSWGVVITYILRGTNHPGRVWTRYAGNPIWAPFHAADCGFRILREVNGNAKK